MIIGSRVVSQGLNHIGGIRGIEPCDYSTRVGFHLKSPRGVGHYNGTCWDNPDEFFLAREDS